MKGLDDLRIMVLAVACFLLVMVCTVPLHAHGAEPVHAPPDLVKAGFITKFPLFVSWPDSSWSPESERIIVGIMGETPIQQYLEQLAALAPVADSRLEIRILTGAQSLNAASGLDSLQILFIAGSEEPRLEKILAQLKGCPVLTVSDTPGFAKRGVHVNFYIENDRVRFELNRLTCEASGLDLSFRLQSVARLVE